MQRRARLHEQRLPAAGRRLARPAAAEPEPAGAASAPAGGAAASDPAAAAAVATAASSAASAPFPAAARAASSGAFRLLLQLRHYLRPFPPRYEPRRHGLRKQRPELAVLLQRIQVREAACSPPLCCAVVAPGFTLPAGGPQRAAGCCGCWVVSPTCKIRVLRHRHIPVALFLTALGVPSLACAIRIADGDFTQLATFPPPAFASCGTEFPGVLKLLARTTPCRLAAAFPGVASYELAQRAISRLLLTDSDFAGAAFSPQLGTPERFLGPTPL